MVPYSTSVFSAADGSFSATVNAPGMDGLTIEAFRIGWQERSRKLEATDAGATLSVVMKKISNTAEQVPPSAWLQGDTDSLAYHMSTLHCSNCHQLGAERVRKFAAKMKALPVERRTEAWLDRAWAYAKNLSPSPTNPLSFVFVALVTGRRT